MRSIELLNLMLIVVMVSGRIRIKWQNCRDVVNWWWSCFLLQVAVMIGCSAVFVVCLFYMIKQNKKMLFVCKCGDGGVLLIF